MLDPLAHDERAPLEREPRERRHAGDEQLAERRLAGIGGGAEHRVVGRDVAPAEHAQTLVGDDRVDRGDDLVGVVAVLGEERDPGGVGAGLGQVEVHHRRAGRRRGSAAGSGAVAGVGLGAGSAPVVEVAEGVDALADHLVALAPVQVHHEGDAAGVVLIAPGRTGPAREEGLDWPCESSSVRSGSRQID